MNYILKTGIIEGSRTITDTSGARPELGANTFLVRILPDMADIQDKDNYGDLLLPRFPNFFPSLDYGYELGERVWVVCASDFQVGYILGPFNYFNGTSIDSFLATINALEKSLSYSNISKAGDLSVVRVSKNYITLANIYTGTTVHIYSSKIFYLFGAEGEILCDNGKYISFISKEGDVVVKGRNLKETYDGNITTTAKTVNETFEAQTVKADSDITLNAAGGVHLIGGTGGVKIVSGTTLSLISTTSIQIMAPLLRLAAFPIIGP